MTEESRGRSQLYLGTPAGVILCVDAVGGAGSDNNIDAQLWHAYSKEPTGVSVPEHMLRAMDALFDLINYPRSTTNLRSFSKSVSPSSASAKGAPSKDNSLRNDPSKSASSQGTPANVTRCLKDEELLEKRGKLATFIIRVQQRQNSNWQGRITWVEKDRTVRFSTIMEMVKLIEKALQP